MNKKIVIFLIFMFSISVFKVNALNNKVKINSDNKYIYYNENFKIDISINSSIPLNNIDGVLEYDKTKLELIEIDTYKGIECSFNDKISCVSKKSLTKSNLFYAIFKPKNSLKVEQNIVISFKKININDGIYNEEDVSKTFKVLKNKTNNDTSLKSLNVNNTSVLDDNTYITTNDSVTISGESNSDSTTIIGLGNKKLKIGENVFNVVAISDSGLKKAYIIKVNRKELPSEVYKDEIKEAEDKTNKLINNNNNNGNGNESNNSLSDLNKSLEQELLLTNIMIAEYSLKFEPYKFIYRFNVPSNISTLNIKAVADKGIDISVEQDNELVFGENIIIINLKRGNKTNKYILYVTRDNQKKSNIKRSNDSVVTNENVKNRDKGKKLVLYIILVLFIVLLISSIIFLVKKKKMDKK